jgi:hypothetical protein
MPTTRRARGPLALFPALALAGTTERLALVTDNGRIGTPVVTTEGRTVDVGWRVDNNGRGPKIREHIVLGPARRDRRHLCRRGRLVVKGGALFFPDEIHAARQITPFAPRVDFPTAGVASPASR